MSDKTSSSRHFIKVLHLISTLDVGGAEGDLLKLVGSADKETYIHEVISMTTIGPVGRELLKKGCRVSSLNMKKGLPDPRGIFELYRNMHCFAPDILHCWMYHANLLGLLPGISARRVWTILCSDMDLSQYGLVYRISARAGALLSGLPSAVVTNSLAGKKHHMNMGYAPRRWEVIANGFDTSRFKPDNRKRQDARAWLGIPENAFAIGMIARLDPMKDHGTFLEAARRYVESHPRDHIVLAGRGTSHDVMRAGLLTERLDKLEQFHFLGECQDIPRVLNALDIVTSSSISEGLPNAIGEAMATGIPCVVTDAGDSAVLVGDTGLVVPKKDPQALCAAWQRLLNAGSDCRKAMAVRARKRIIEHYSLSAMTGRYETLYKNLTTGPAG